MLSKQEAMEVFKESLPDGYGVMEEWTIERNYGFVFFAQSNQFLASRDPQDMAIGMAGSLVEKATGRIIHFASAYSTALSLEIYESGYLAYDDIDILITKVLDEREAISLIMELGLQYVVPEVDGDIVWRIPKQYKHSQIKQFLRTLPCRFNVGSPYFRWQQLKRINTSKALKTELLPNTGFQNPA